MNDKTFKNAYICLGKQQKYHDKAYYNIQSLYTGNFLVLNNDVGKEKQGIYAEDLKKLLLNPNIVPQIEILNLGLTQKNQFYEKSMSNSECAKKAEYILNSMCFSVGMRAKINDPNLILRYCTEKLGKNVDSIILCGAQLCLNHYVLTLRRDCFGYYYVYDNKFLCCERIKSKNMAEKYMDNAIKEEFYRY